MTRKLSLAKLAVAIAAAIAFWVSPPSVRAQSDELIRALPDDTGVAVVDVKQLMSSELFTTARNGTRIRSFLDALTGGFSAAGLRPTDIESVVISFHDFDAAHVTAAVRAPFRPDSILEKLRSDPRLKLTSVEYKGQQLHTVIFGAGPSSQQRSFVFVDDNTMVFGTPDAVRSAVDVRKGAKPSLGDNAKLTATLAQAGSGTIRFATIAPAAMTSVLPANTVPLPDLASVNAIFGTIAVTSGIEVAATLRNDKPENAKIIADQLNGLLTMARGFLGASTDPRMAPVTQLLKSVSITGTDVDVKVAANLSKEFLASGLK